MDYVKSFGLFLAFYVITNVVVKPIVDQMNLPLIGTNL